MYFATISTANSHEFLTKFLSWLFPSGRGDRKSTDVDVQNSRRSVVKAMGLRVPGFRQGVPSLAAKQWLRSGDGAGPRAPWRKGGGSYRNDGGNIIYNILYNIVANMYSILISIFLDCL